MQCLILLLVGLAAAYPVEEPEYDAYAPTYASQYADYHEGLIKYGPAPLGPDGVVIDTPEVANAKALHLEAYKNVYYGIVPEYASEYYDEYGPAPLGHDGRVVDTPEVALAKSAHLSAYHAIAQDHKSRAVLPPQDLPEVKAARAAHLAAYNAIAKAHHQYNPHALLAHGGQYLSDTPEVAHARAQHLATAAAAYNAYSYSPAYPYHH